MVMFALHANERVEEEEEEEKEEEEEEVVVVVVVHQIFARVAT